MVFLKEHSLMMMTKLLNNGLRATLVLLLFFFSTATRVASCLAQSTSESASDLERQLRAIQLPLVIVDTENGENPTYERAAKPDGCMGVGMINKTEVRGRLRIVLGDSTLYDSGDFDGEEQTGMKIKIRGNGSVLFPDKPYKVKLQKKCDLLFRGNDDFKDKNWLLLNFNYSRDLRNEVGFRLAELAGLGWQPAHHWVNFMLNGHYQGVYWLCETVRRAKTRCNISKSGFLVECDAYWWTNEKPYFTTSYVSNTRSTHKMAYTFKYPDEDDGLDSTRMAHVRNYLLAFEDALASGGDVAQFIDMESFATWILLHDAMGQSDGYGSNIFLHKYDYDLADSLSSKLKIGPVWDLGCAYLTPKDEWVPAHIAPEFYFKYLLQRSDFVDIYRQKWLELRGQIDGGLTQLFDSISTNLADAINVSRQITYEINQPDFTYVSVSIEEDMQEARDWFKARIPWMDTAVENLVASTDIQGKTFATGLADITVYDLSGKVCGQAYGVYPDTWLRSLQDNASLPKGVYILQVKGSGHSLKVMKWVRR